MLDAVPRFPAIEPLDTAAMTAARDRWATRAKPPGSLGRLEDLAVHLAGITSTCPPPPIQRPAIVVFAADHGVVADGASAWPSQITALMVHTMSQGRAAINAFAAVTGAEVHIVDVGVNADLSHLEGIHHHKVRPGTDSIAHGPAMSRGDAARAIDVGRIIGENLIVAGVDCLVGGDMGIGNTTPSAALIGALTDTPAHLVTGVGAGLPIERLPHKQTLIASAIERAKQHHDPLDLLAEIGGLEIAALAGLYITAAANNTPVILDGVVAGAAACVAEALAPRTVARTIAGHLSSEPAAAIALRHLRLEPLLHLGLRLGEGTGACLAITLLRAAIAALTHLADLPKQ
ncbi:MAG TPA: nicotinate-nucleotide--dimethylbenzimidazole phosphoribosyltransferase [Acidimicrobiia bacterium]|nr:nicotinate-nucleotide--dimethylbenzimidazole phosphoribosyltransferase [Acidimicrobiia bacterium]